MTESKKRLNIILCLVFSIQSFISFGQNTLQSKIEQIVKSINGNVGVFALVIETGKSASFNGDKKFPMQSVYKFPIAMAILYNIDKGNYSLEDTVNISDEVCNCEAK